MNKLAFDVSSFRVQFPEYKPEDMPAKPAGFVDCSWKNDSMPHFINLPARLSLWCDYANPDDRENGPAWERFAVFATDEDGVDLSDALFVSEDWAPMRAFLDYRIAHAALLLSPIGRKLDAAGFKIWNAGGNLKTWRATFSAKGPDGTLFISIYQNEDGIGEDGNEDGWNVTACDDNELFYSTYDLTNQTLDTCLAFVASKL